MFASFEVIKLFYMTLRRLFFQLLNRLRVGLKCFKVPFPCYEIQVKGGRKEILPRIMWIETVEYIDGETAMGISVCDSGN